MRRRATVAAVIATASAFLAAPVAAGSAHAADSVPRTAIGNGSGCGNRTTVYPFTFAGDDNPYWLVNGGDFESMASRWFGSGISRSYENEPWQVGGSWDGTSASLDRAGAVLSAPGMCVTDTEPTVRFFYKAPGTPGARLAVKMRTTSAVTSHVKTVYLDGSVPGWRLSAPLSITDSTDVTGTQNLLLDFVSQGGAWKIDDVYVDPWKYTIK